MTSAHPAESTSGDVSLNVQAAQDAVTSDPDLSPVEKETSISFCNEDAHALVSTENATLIRDLLGYPYFEPTEFRVSDETRFGARMSPGEWQADGGPITGVKGRLSLGCLKFLASRRDEDWVSFIVSDQANEDGGSS